MRSLLTCKWVLIFTSLAVCLAFGSFASAQPTNFVAHLSGAEEVPPTPTNAQGQAKFQLLSDGSALHFQLNVANVNDLLMAHIHLAAAGTNGGIVVWLYPSGPPSILIPGRFSGVLAAGAITDASLVGDLDGQTVADLIAELEAGNAYVNVHSVDNPGGEIRGQIQ